MNDSDMRGVLYLGSNDTRVASGIENAIDMGTKSAFVRNLYDTDATNSILEIGLVLHRPIFEEMDAPFFDVR